MFNTEIQPAGPLQHEIGTSLMNQFRVDPRFNHCAISWDGSSHPKVVLYVRLYARIAAESANVRLFEETARIGHAHVVVEDGHIEVTTYRYAATNKRRTRSIIDLAEPSFLDELRMALLL